MSSTTNDSFIIFMNKILKQFYGYPITNDLVNQIDSTLKEYLYNLNNKEYTYKYVEFKFKIQIRDNMIDICPLNLHTLITFSGYGHCINKYCIATNTDYFDCEEFTAMIDKDEPNRSRLYVKNRE